MAVVTHLAFMVDDRAVIDNHPLSNHCNRRDDCAGRNEASLAEAGATGNCGGRMK